MKRNASALLTLTLALLCAGCPSHPTQPETPEDRAVREAVQLARVQALVVFLEAEAAAFVADGTLKAEDVATYAAIAKGAVALGIALQQKGNAATVQERIDAQKAMDQALFAAAAIALDKLRASSREEPPPVTEG